MFDKILTMWFLIIFIVLVTVTYRALGAIKFSNLFQRASTWQIRFLVTLISIILAFLTSFAFIYTIERIVSVF